MSADGRLLRPHKDDKFLALKMAESQFFFFNSTARIPVFMYLKCNIYCMCVFIGRCLGLVIEAKYIYFLLFRRSYSHKKIFSAHAKQKSFFSTH